MKNYEIEIDPNIFNSIYLPHLNNLSRTQIFYGGSSSGKSVFIAQRCILDIVKGGRNYLVCRQVARTIKNSVFAQITRVINEWGLGDLFTINKSDYIITCVNGYQIIFVGLDDVEKIKSIVPAKGAWTDIWIEEATEIDRASFKQLEKRQRGGDDSIPKRIMFSFNPVLKMIWIYKEFFEHIGWADDQKEYKDNDISILRTTYRDNKFLTQDDILRLKNEKDKYYFDVYSEGLWGVLGNVIFKNWSIEDLSGMHDQFTNHKNGLDFGFSSDPAAIAATHYDRKNKTIYFYDELYETELTNDVLARITLEKIGRQLVVCDSAEPKSIQELRAHGVMAVPAKKGKDSILYGIQWLQQQKIVIDSRCINARNEFSQYKWREDSAGNALPVPVDKNDHLISALRYAYEDEALQPAVQIYDSPI